MAGWGELPWAYQGVAGPDPWEAEWALTPAAVSVHWGQQAVLDPLLVVLLELGADLPEEEQLLSISLLSCSSTTSTVSSSPWST